MPKIVQQIQTRFKFFQIFWLVQILFIPVFVVLGELLNAENYNRLREVANEVNSTSSFDYKLIIIFLLFFLISLLFGIVATIFYAMLTHGIFNYLKKHKESNVNPSWAVWSMFIPVASNILVALNLNKAFESLGIKSPTAKNNLYYSIFSLVATTILVFGNIFYTFYELFNSELKPIILKPFMNYSFYISVFTTMISIGLFYFIWKTVKEMKDAIVAENIN
jgi:hypothetical protein